jgi:hypothetical protein
LNIFYRMPVHLNGVLMSGGFRGGSGGHESASGGGGVSGYRSAAGLSPGMRQRTASLEMLNNIKFEEKRALIASTLSLNDLLKPSQDYRLPASQAKHSSNAHHQHPHHAQFSPVGGAGGGAVGGGGYMLASSLYKSNSAVMNGYANNVNSYSNNVNFLNNGIAEKDLGIRRAIFLFCQKNCAFSVLRRKPRSLHSVP